MKHYFQPIAVTLFSIVLLTSCQKETPGSLPSNDAANPELSTNANNTTTANRASTAATAVFGGGVKGYDLTLTNILMANGKLSFIVANKGTLIAPTCKVQITYSCNGTFRTVYLDVINKTGAANIAMSLPIQAVCFIPDIQFTIVVDYYNVVSETNEYNNSFNSIY